MKLNIYIDKNVITTDYEGGRQLLMALSSLLQVSDSFSVSVLMKGMEPLPNEIIEYFPYTKLDASFKELMESIPIITKDEIYLSFNSDNLFKWDDERGKAILILPHPHSHDLELSFNKIYLTSEKEEILKKLRSYIHI